MKAPTREETDAAIMRVFEAASHIRATTGPMIPATQAVRVALKFIAVFERHRRAQEKLTSLNTKKELDHD